MEPLITPTVNLNGTSKAELVQLVMDCYRAASTLNDAMGKAMPNGRDFQTMMPGTDTVARKAWGERRLAVHALMQELQDHAIAINEQGDRS